MRNCKQKRALPYLVQTLNLTCMWNTVRDLQHAKKVMSSSPRVVDFPVGIVDSVLYFPNRQGKVSSENI